MSLERKLITELQRLIRESAVIPGFFNGVNFKRNDNNQIIENKELLVTANQPGDAFVVWFAAENKWLLVSSVNNYEIRKTIVNERRFRRQTTGLVYPIRTLLFADLFGYPKPPDNNSYEYFISGNKRLKPQGSLAVSGNSTLLFSSDDAFVINTGNVALTYTKEYDDDTISSFGGNAALPYKKERIKSLIESIETGLYHWSSVSQFNYTNAAVQYMGNGIWQSYIEDGMTELVNSAKDSIDGYYLESVVQVAGQDIYGFDLTTSAATEKLIAVVLPAASNTVFVDMAASTFAGSHSTESLVVSTQNITWGLRNKNISHTSYLPHGNSSFAYTALRAASGSNYTYTENIDGEMLGLVFTGGYITQTVDLQQVTSYNDIGGGSYSQSYAVSGTQSLQLYSGSTVTELNTTSKFLSLPNNPLLTTVLSTTDYTTTFTLTTATTSFGLRYTETATLFAEAVDYTLINAALNLSLYEGEQVIMCKIIAGNSYLITATISDCNYSAGTNSITIGFSGLSFKRLPTVKNYSAIVPFDRIVLNNGNFWNFYFSSNTKRNLVKHPMIRWRTNRWGFGYGSDYQIFALLCDQTLPHISLHPFTKYLLWRPYSERTVQINSDGLLASTSFVSNVFYVVSANGYFQDYQVGSSPTNLKNLIVSEWRLNTTSGNVTYSKSYLVPYGLKYPYIEDGTLQASGVVPQSHSYYPS